MQAGQVIALFLFGWGGGILVNYLADVLPTGDRRSFPACAGCGARQPLANYLFWPRRCSQCGRKRSWRAWIIEAVVLVGTFWLGFSRQASFQDTRWLGFALGLAVLLYFAMVIVIDIEHRLILLSTTLVGALLGLAVGIVRTGTASSLVGGLAGLLAMLVLFLFGGLFGKLLGRLRGKPVNDTVFGFGDVLLGGVIGLMVGWPEITRSLLITILAAGVFSLLYLALLLIQRRYRLGSVLPYAPFLILGAVLTMQLL